MEKENFVRDDINRIITLLKNKIKDPLKDLLLFSRITKKRFNANFYLLIQCVTNMMFFTEFYHYLKRHCKCKL